MLLHIVAACLVYAVLAKLRIPGAILAAAIFALHPVHVESVAWISEQKNTLSAVFYLGALLVYLRFDETRNWPSYFAAIALFVLGLLSKTVTATLPAALLVILWWQLGSLSWRRDVLPLVPLLVLGAMAGLVTAWVERNLIGAKGEAFEIALIERGLLAGRVPWFYFSKLIWPANLAFIYPRWNIDPHVWWQWLFPAATLSTLVALWAVRKRWRAPLAGVLLFVGTLVPVMGFLNVYPFIYSFVADHFQYLASLGIIVLAAAAIVVALRRYLPENRPLGQAICVALVAILAVLTTRQCRMYRDIVVLYQTTIETNPSCWLAHLNLGTVLVNSQRPEEAIGHFQRALEIRPGYVDAHSNLGILVFQLGRRQEGMKHLEQAVRLDPTNPDAQMDIANALVVTGQAEKAVEHGRKAVELLPTSGQARHGLGVALSRAGKYHEAAEQLQRGIELQPKNADMYDALSKAYAQLERPDDAIAAAEEGIAVARASRQLNLAARFESWLTLYRARQAGRADIAPAADTKRAAP